jgi:hypothetical protein
MMWKILCACVVSAFFLIACNNGSDGGESGSGGSAGGGGTGGSSGSGGAPPNGEGSATLTIGEETWEFDSFGFAFGHDATQSDLFSFSSNSFGEHSNGARVQMQAEIEDPTSQGRYEGDGVIYTVYITDIEDFMNPSVDWESTSREIPGVMPSGQTVVHIDGNHITAEGLFDDQLTEDVFEQVPGTLDATCGSQSRR